MQAYVQMSVCHAKNFNGVQACNQCENSDSVSDGGDGGDGDDNEDDNVSNGSHSLDPCLICINTGGSV